jgi:hypothetical protein
MGHIDGRSTRVRSDKPVQPSRQSCGEEEGEGGGGGGVRRAGSIVVWIRARGVRGRVIQTKARHARGGGARE